MTIQRQYTLPHCNLLLEGLGNDANDPLSPLTVLMNAECRLPGATDATLSGGREFLDSLVTAVSRYGQRLLSGVPYPVSTGTAPPLVDLKPDQGPYHHLIVQQQPFGEPVSDVNAQPPLDIKLTTVQFYDLMEAIDQLLADTQTLPDLTAQFQAVSRRLVQPTEPITKRAAPAALGAAALAAAGLALFFVPPPQFEPPRPETESTAPADASNGDPAETTPPSGDETAADDSSAELTPEGEGDLARLGNAPAITDAAAIALLQSDVARRLQAAWADAPRPSGELAYRMVVAENGDILGYKYENDLALAEVDNTPLPDLTFVPVAGAEPVSERVAQFIATFTPAGEVVVEPTAQSAAASDESSAETTDRAAATGELPPLEDKVTDGDRIRALNSTLYDSLLAELEPLSANEALRFRVRLTESGKVVGYEPINAAAGLLAAETPLPGLVNAADSAADQADFQVVFTEKGVLEVSPWDGWPQ